MRIQKSPFFRGHNTDLKIKTGRPLGGAAFIEKLEHLTGRVLKIKAPGRPGRERE